MLEAHDRVVSPKVGRHWVPKVFIMWLLGALHVVTHITGLEELPEDAAFPTQLAAGVSLDSQGLRMLPAVTKANKPDSSR